MHNCLYDEFKTTQNFFNIWENILTSCDDLFRFSEVASRIDPHLDSFKDMLAFIRTNYAEKITLDDIAAAGNVSRTLCNTIFNDTISRTPFEELMRFRCQKACELLEASKLPISEVAVRTGFNSANYLTMAFKKNYGLSPREYLKKFTLE